MIADLKPYPSMKDSGVPWMGEVPEHWGIERAKWLFRKMDRPVRDIDEVVTCFRDGTVTLRRNRRVTGFTEALQETGYQGIHRGDLVIHAMDAFAGAIGDADSDGKGTPVYSVCKPMALANPHYYAYALREMARSRWIEVLARGVRERSTDFRFDEFARQALPVPPIADQAGIVRFLAYADKRIQRYIRAKRQMIRLLEEQRQAIIRRVVTFGLDPNVRTKRSEIEWVGDMPEHWTTCRLRDTVRGCFNGVWGEEPDGQDDLVCVRVADFERGRRRVGLDQPTIRAITSNLRRVRLLQRDDLLIEKSGGGDQQPVGMVVLYDHDTPAVCSNFVARMPIAEGFDPGYLVYVHEYLYAIRLNTRSIKQTTGIQNLDSGAYLREPMAFPTLGEQGLIVEYLDRETTRIVAGIDSARREIELLKELSVRLVADVVTGKLDVRDAAAQLPAELDEFGDDADQELEETENELDTELEEIEA